VSLFFARLFTVLATIVLFVWMLTPPNNAPEPSDVIAVAAVAVAWSLLAYKEG
jgi:hypothetical protein